MIHLNSEYEKDIISRLQEDDERAMVPIFKLYHRSMFYFTKSLVTMEEQAEDLVADAFLKVWEKRYEFEDLESIKAFMIVALRNASINHLKHIQRKTAAHEKILFLAEKDSHYLEAKIVKANLIQLILQEVESLPPMRRKIFKMIFLEGLSVIEIARELDISPDTVRVQKARAVQGLQAVLLKKKIYVDLTMIGAGLSLMMEQYHS